MLAHVWVSLPRRNKGRRVCCVLTCPIHAVTIKETLSQLFNEPRQHVAINHIVQQCFNIALAYLHHRLRRGSLIDNQFGISNEDLAMDCIAELYQRDETGTFIVLRQYFDSISWEKLSDEELQVALRRLVFSKVNEGLFRNYREEDPNLAKIIRNIKEAVKHKEKVNLMRYRETNWLVYGPEDATLNHLPLAPAEVLEAYLFSVVCNTSNVYTAVGIIWNVYRNPPLLLQWISHECLCTSPAIHVHEPKHVRVRNGRILLRTR